MLAELISNFTFVQSVEIPEFTKTYNTKYNKTDEELIIPPKKQGNPDIYCGIWQNKNIRDIKQFRNKLWQRNN